MGFECERRGVLRSAARWPFAMGDGVKLQDTPIPRAIGFLLKHFIFASGCHLTLLLQISPFRGNGNFMLGSRFKFSLLGYGQPWLIGVNPFAAGVACWLACRHGPKPGNLA